MSKEINKNISEEQALIKKYLDEVERKLPLWLKDDKDNVQEILDELENHIWDRSTELSNGRDPTKTQIEQVLEQMGKPSKIADEYKRRGKPKFFITEELWEMYQKIIIIFCAVLIGFNLIGTLAGIGRNTPGELASGFFSGIIISCSIAIILITVQFVLLSKEGYLPEDFKRFVHVINIKTYTEYKKDKEAAEAAKSQSFEDESVKIIHETQTTPIRSTVIANEPVIKTKTAKTTKVYREPRVIVEKPVRPKVKPYFGRDYLGEGISGIVFGLIVIIFPFMPFLDFLHIELKIWLAIFGGLILIIGIIRFMQALAGRLLRFQQVLMFISIIPNSLMIPLFLQLRRVNRPEIIYNWLKTLIVPHYLSEYHLFIIIEVFVWFIVAVTIISCISELARIAKLEVKGFTVRK